MMNKNDEYKDNYPTDIKAFLRESPDHDSMLTVFTAAIVGHLKESLVTAVLDIMTHLFLDSVFHFITMTS